MSSSVGLTACTVNSSDFNVRMNVSLIDQEPDHREIYQALRERYIAPAAQAADVGDNHAAREL